MPDIGETLREARMRRRIDIAEVETATKIRAKYLRALENEEWGLLPGTTFVKTFLRTYAEYLELDSRSLVEEYKQRYERPAHGELAPFGGLGGPRSRPQRHRRRRSRASFGPAAVVIAGVVVLLAAFYALGKLGPDTNDDMPVATPTPTPTRTPAASKKQHKKATAPAVPRTVALRIEATGDVYVCLTDANGHKLLDGATLHAGERSKTFRSRRLHARFGNNAATMRVAGKRYAVARSTTPVDYELKPGKAPRRLPATTRTACG
jgi:cytoskeletal protein RodZ